MMRTPPAKPGDRLDNVDTPALIVDLDALEHNLDRMQEIADAAGVVLRPHAKTHKCPTIGGWQVTRGAVGQCCQKTEEAERLVEGGVEDVYVSNEVVGATKLARLAKLARHANISVCVDDARNVADLSTAASKAGSTLDVLVELEVGGGRCGVRNPQAAADLAIEITGAPALRFAGLHVYNGSIQHARTRAERLAAGHVLQHKVGETLEALSGKGLECPRITGTGTGSFREDIEVGCLNELQCGSYVFMDADYGRNLGGGDAPISDFRQSLFVLATVMSKPEPGLAVLDAGLKALAFDSGPPLIDTSPGLTYLAASDEHGEISGAPESLPTWGSKILLVPGHCDPTVNLHDHYVGVRNGVVEKVWAIAARGAGT